jgi:hypothetical protein
LRAVLIFGRGHVPGQWQIIFARPGAQAPDVLPFAQLETGGLFRGPADLLGVGELASEFFDEVLVGFA